MRPDLNDWGCAEWRADLSDREKETCSAFAGHYYSGLLVAEKRFLGENSRRGNGQAKRKVVRNDLKWYIGGMIAGNARDYLAGMSFMLRRPAVDQ
jgi:hypothetical protein